MMLKKPSQYRGENVITFIFFTFNKQNIKAYMYNYFKMNAVLIFGTV